MVGLAPVCPDKFSGPPPFVEYTTNETAFNYYRVAYTENEIVIVIWQL